MAKDYRCKSTKIMNAIIRENEDRGYIKIDFDKILICKLTKAANQIRILSRHEKNYSLINISSIRPYTKCSIFCTTYP